SVDGASEELAKAGLPARIMVDYSHSNSSKQHEKQIDENLDVCARVAAGESRIFGVMAESHLNAGRQDLVPGKELLYGVSITDACIGWGELGGKRPDLAHAGARR